MKDIFQIELFEQGSGKKPFEHWIKSISKQHRSIILTRLARLRLGNFGDCKSLKGTSKLFEARYHIGPGFRVYFGKDRGKIIVLLCGGSKTSQKKDILKAKKYWEEYLQLR